MKNRTYSFEELKEFILSRKDNQKVNMNQNSIDSVKLNEDYCGCILVHFFRKKFKNKVKSVGYVNGILLKEEEKYDVLPSVSDEKQIYKFIYKAISENPKTYKAVKKIIQNL